MVLTLEQSLGSACNGSGSRLDGSSLRVCGRRESQRWRSHLESDGGWDGGNVKRTYLYVRATLSSFAVAICCSSTCARFLHLPFPDLLPYGRFFWHALPELGVVISPCWVRHALPAPRAEKFSLRGCGFPFPQHLRRLACVRRKTKT